MKYIGQKKIKSEKVAERKTYLGKEVLEIQYSDSTKEEFPKEMAETIKTDKPIDLTALREKQIEPIVRKILAILLESEIKVLDTDYVLQRIRQSVNITLDKADEKLWGKELPDKNFYDVNKVLTDGKQNIPTRSSIDRK